jgi:hypothetical protein
VATYYRDFADGISDFTELVCTATHDAAFTVVNTNQVQGTASTTSANVGLFWDDINSDADRDDVEILGQIYVDSTSTSQRWLCVRVAGGDTSNKTGYALRMRTGSIDLYRFTSNTFTQLATTTISVSSGTWCWVRFRVNGTSTGATQKARYWVDGGSEDTGSWHVEATDSTYSDAARVGLMKGANTNTQLWRCFGVGTNGDTAPSSAPVTKNVSHLLCLGAG